jgi:hypothetical protein
LPDFSVLLLHNLRQNLDFNSMIVYSEYV